MRGRPKKKDAMMINAEREAKAYSFADKIINQNMTIRQIAKESGMSKSTVHKYLHTYIDSKPVQEKLSKSLMTNFNEKHLHGGKATQKLYAEKRAKEKAEKTH